MAGGLFEFPLYLPLLETTLEKKAYNRKCIVNRDYGILSSFPKMGMRVIMLFFSTKNEKCDKSFYH